jgi:hypothetical protein
MNLDPAESQLPAKIRVNRAHSTHSAPHIVDQSWKLWLRGISHSFRASITDNGGHPMTPFR